MRLGESINPAELKTPKIVLDYFRAEKKLEKIYRPYPSSPADLKKQIQTRSLSVEERKRLSQALHRYQKELGASKKSLENAEKFSDPSSFAIVTGQQPGFLLGPMFTLLKAATAVRLALDLQKEGLPAVPLFWNHSEDHDLEETNHCFLSNRNYELQKFRLPYPNEKKFLSEVTLDEQVQSVFEAVREILPETEFRDEALELFRPRVGNSLSQELSRILLSLFAEQGLVLIEPAALRELSFKPLVELLRSKEGLDSLLELNREALRKSGYEPLISSDQALLFERVKAQRLRIQREGKFWILPSGKKLSDSELAAEIEKTPARFSPGALLRPLTQCWAIPAAVYIGGPTEIAYSAENRFLFDKLSLPAPVLLPRFSATFVESSAAKILERLHLNPKEFFIPEAQLRKKFPSPQNATSERIIKIEGDAKSKLRALESEIRELDPALLGPLSKTESSLSSSLEKFREKVANAALNRAGTGERQLKKLSVLLFPKENLQERALNPLHFFVRHGLDFASELVQMADPFERNHRIVYLDGKENEQAG